MSQNSERLHWTAEEVDNQLKSIMHNIYQMSVDAAEEYGLGYNLVPAPTSRASRRLPPPWWSRACSKIFQNKKEMQGFALHLVVCAPRPPGGSEIRPYRCSGNFRCTL